MSEADNALPDPARIALRRRLEWIDTDAAGIYHYTTAFRYAEAAEAALHTALGIETLTFGATPRLEVSAAFHHSLRFNDVVDVSLAASKVGRTSATYEFTLSTGGTLAVEGRVATCLVDMEAARPVPWPEDARRALAEGGVQVAA